MSYLLEGVMQELFVGPSIAKLGASGSKHVIAYPLIPWATRLTHPLIIVAASAAVYVCDAKSTPHPGADWDDLSRLTRVSPKS
jgi:hypothetical protein